MTNWRDDVSAPTRLGEPDVVPILEDWHKYLAKKAETIFNEVSQSWAFDTVDPKRVALAWRELRNSIYSKKLREMLGLQAKKQLAQQYK